MAFTVDAAFNSFYDDINLTGDHRQTANTRKDDVVETLKKQFEVLMHSPQALFRNLRLSRDEQMLM